MAATAKTADAATDIDGSGDAAAKGGKKKLPMKMIIIGAVAVVALGGGGTFAFLKFKGGAHKGEHHEAVVAKPAIFVDMPDVLVNLANGSVDRPQYLKVKIVLEVADQAAAQQIQPLMPRIMDAFQTYLRELRSTDLDGSVGLFRLREELTRRVNAALAPGHVNAVLFKEIIIQ
jgi:flagellar FliL protein